MRLVMQFLHWGVAFLNNPQNLIILGIV